MYNISYIKEYPVGNLSGLGGGPLSAASVFGSKATPVLDNLQVWFDPRRFSSLGNGNTCTSHPLSLQSNVTWTLVTDGSPSYDTGVQGNQGIKVGSSTHQLKFITYNQDVTQFDNVQNYSFEFWVYVGAQNIGGWGFIGGKSRFWGNNDGGIFILNTGTDWGVHSSGGSGGTVDMAANGWHHIVYVRDITDSNCRKFYVDNNLAFENNGGDGSNDHVLNNNCALTIGCSTDNTVSNSSDTNYAPKNDFRYGHARFYTRGLSAAMVERNFNLEKSIYGL